jgi:hypothetical protein
MIRLVLVGEARAAVPRAPNRFRCGAAVRYGGRGGVVHTGAVADRRVRLRLLRRVRRRRDVLDTAPAARDRRDPQEEEANWPAGKPGTTTSATVTLEQVADQLRAEQPKDPHCTHRRSTC